MTYLIQRIAKSELTGTRYVAEEQSIEASSDEEAKAAMKDIAADWDCSMLRRSTKSEDAYWPTLETVE